MANKRSRYFRIEGTHDNYRMKALGCLVLLLCAWAYSFWETMYVTVSLYKYSPAGAYNSLLLIPAVWLFIYEYRHPDFLVPRVNYS